MYVFVYGSLKKGYWNHPVLGGSEFITEAVTEDEFVLTDCGFPYLIRPESLSEEVQTPISLPVVGEVYKVTDKAVKASLDRLEGVPHHYKHLNITVFGDDDEGYECLTYTSANPDLDLNNTLCGVDNDDYYIWKE